MPKLFFSPLGTTSYIAATNANFWDSRAAQVEARCLAIKEEYISCSRWEKRRFWCPMKRVGSMYMGPMPVDSSGSNFVTRFKYRELCLLFYFFFYRGTYFFSTYIVEYLSVCAVSLWGSTHYLFLFGLFWVCGSDPYNFLIPFMWCVNLWIWPIHFSNPLYVMCRFFIL
jgi:hypothetical protein